MNQLARDGAITAHQAKRLAAEWYELDEDSHHQPWYRQITEMTWLVIETPRQADRNYTGDSHV